MGNKLDKSLSNSDYKQSNNKKYSTIINFVDNLTESFETNNFLKVDRTDPESAKLTEISREKIKSYKSNNFSVSKKPIKKDVNFRKKVYYVSKYKPRFRAKLKIIIFLTLLIVISIAVVTTIFAFILVDKVADSDNDGIPDYVDLFPDKNAMIRFSVRVFKYQDAGNLSAYKSFYYKFFELFNFNWENFSYDSVGNFSTKFQSLKLNYNTFSFDNATIDVADDVRFHDIVIQFFMYGNELTSFVDIDDDDTGGLTLRYDLVSGTWTGDDSTGISDGSIDGIIEDKDCYLEYHLETV